jgi:hypothetical protein
MRRPRRVLTLAAALAGAAALTACNPHTFEKVAMSSAYRPEHPRPEPKGPPGSAPPYELLAGDLHCHVSPPDDPGDVTRGVSETVALAAEEGLDFVVLTPHLPARFFADPELRARAAAGAAEMRRAFSGKGGTLFIPGFEYTDHRFGHVGASFADLGKVLDEVPVDVARSRPERFFERWVAGGGLLVVNHPLVTPLDSVFARARGDMSWRPWTSRVEVPPEIAAVGHLAGGFEAYNAAVAQLRDRFLLGDADLSLRGVMARLDREIVASGRRIAPVGGSDSHAGYLRATTFVLAEHRTEAAVRDAILAGRVCVRSPDACSLEVRAPGGRWVGVGGAVERGAVERGAAEGGAAVVEVRARGDRIVVVRDGEAVATPASGRVVQVEVPAGRCALVRARVDEGYSGPVYVNCGFATPGAGQGVATSAGPTD